ncbi:MAG: hypothetical protein JWO79_1391 [Actinomycetia bacterium]|nr:hypothetical protein [Actinomycetes bacterium]MDQ1654415.1 hypothetical protein [Cryptosporangiaceae bacterium]MDQ1656005.1 hypothetical protein [Cryptosporangiaceae bacterium]
MRTVVISPSERRKAERFAAQLDGRNSPSGAGSSAPLLDLSARLRAIEVDASVDPLYRDRLRTRLLAVASVQGVGGESGARPSRAERHQHAQATNRVPRRIAVAASTVTAIVALSGISMASGGANPGDTLYSVKRSREAAQLALARSDTSRGQLLLEFARNRLVEAITVRNDAAELDRALGSMDANTKAGMAELGQAALDNAETAPLDIVDDFVATQRRQLIAGLIAPLPEDRHARPLASLNLIEAVRIRSAKLRPSVVCNGQFAGAAKHDSLGIQPRPCAKATREVPGTSPVPGGTSPTVPVPGTDRRSTPQRVTPGASGSPAAAGQPQTGGAGPSGVSAPERATDPSAQPSSDPATGGLDGVLGSVTDTVGGAVGGVVGPLSESPPVPQLP